ncbi:MAG: UDP-N-acetylmuramoyl-tripeptide--D-alanyl-D-alanine ligase [Deltaproteobacteria bacterium]|nr:UDP-N-acetylmuramoyl-tripeptide--D-alanyl-D-alanine ligase [Deltaproteobacteria bacterium]
MEPQVAMTLADVTRATGGRALTPARGPLAGASIDSRSLQRDDVFFALPGTRGDGHDFGAAALQAGAGALVVAAGRAPEFVTAAAGARAAVVAVDDVRRALADLARARRLQVGPTVVGVTGSNGKTTTKELLAAILETAAGEQSVLATSGNLNNSLGVPLTLLRLHPGHCYAVVEMGMSAPGEIASLCSLAAPAVGVITGIAPAHLEHLGSLEAIARAKGELFAALPPSGIAIFPDDQPLLAAEAARLPAAQRRTFGTGADATVRIAAVVPRGAAGLALDLVVDGVAVHCDLPLPGPHNARNAAAAAAAAAALGVAPAVIAAGLARGRTAAHRSTIVAVAGRHVIDDCYNANPASPRAGLEMLASLRPAGRTAVAVLGDMLELGPRAPELHREVGQAAARLGIDHLVAVGVRAQEILRGARRAGMDEHHLAPAPDPAAAAVEVQTRTSPGDWVLVKASRGMRLERVLEELRRLAEPGAEPPPC